MKKVLISLFSLFLSLGIITTASLVHANMNENEVVLINPKNKTATTNNVVLVSGKGLQGTKVKIDTYLSNLLRDQKVDLNNPPKGGYVLVVSEDIKIGESGSFARELSLSNGLNRIEVRAENSLDSQTKYVYITDMDKTCADLISLNDIKFIGALKSLIK